VIYCNHGRCPRACTNERTVLTERNSVQVDWKCAKLQTGFFKESVLDYIDFGKTSLLGVRWLL